MPRRSWLKKGVDFSIKKISQRIESKQERRRRQLLPTAVDVSRNLRLMRHMQTLTKMSTTKKLTEKTRQRLLPQKLQTEIGMVILRTFKSCKKLSGKFSNPERFIMVKDETANVRGWGQDYHDQLKVCDCDLYKTDLNAFQ